MKYALTLLRIEERTLQNQIQEVLLKAEEIPMLPQFSVNRQQAGHHSGLYEARLKEVREALKILEVPKMEIAKK